MNQLVHFHTPPPHLRKTERVQKITFTILIEMDGKSSALIRTLDELKVFVVIVIVIVIIVVGDSSFTTIINLPQHLDNTSTTPSTTLSTTPSKDH